MCLGQIRLSHPIKYRTVTKMSIDRPEQNSHEVYEEYTKRRKTLKNGSNCISGFYKLIPMGTFNPEAKALIYDAEKFCTWNLSDFRYCYEKTATTNPSASKKLPTIGETIMMAPSTGFYTNLK